MGPQQEDYIETVFTCEGDYNDPHLQDRLEDFQKSLKDLLLTDKNKLILKKVEPWNSVRVTFNIPREAAVRLKQLAQQRNETLRELGVLAVQIQNQHISLTIAGRNNERTQLVFRTAETSAVTTPSVSVFESNSPSLDQLGPQGPGPSKIESSSKKITDYLRQNSSIIDTLLHNPTQLGKVYPTSTAVDVANKGKVNNIYAPSFTDHVAGYPLSASHSIPSSSSPSINMPTPSRSPVPGPRLAPPVSGHQSGLPAGLPPGPRHPSLDNLPPPPPYPQGSSFINNFQRFANTGASPLLVNLLQNDPNLSSLLAAGRLPVPVDTDNLPPPVKKKRKPPKKKKTAEGTVPIKSSVQNPALSSGNSSDSFPVTSLPSTTITSTSFVNHGVNPNVRENAFHNPQAMHNTNMQVHSEQNVPLTSPLVQKKSDESDTAGKIINPVTGVLEPMEIASDISPAKSDSSTGKQHSPRSLSQKMNTKVETVGDVPDQKSVDSGLHGKPVSGVPQQAQDITSIHLLPHRRAADNELSKSSQFGGNAPNALSQHQKSIQEVMKNDLLAKGHLKNNIKLEQKLPVTEHLGETVTESKTCDRLTDIKNSITESECVTNRDVLPQESEQKSIPCQLLNKPLLQVKHNSSGGKPSGSPDSNGDSECSTQSINLDTHNGSQSDPRTYNNDSGVGSCSERSDDTPSEPGDSDYKSGHTSSFECAKTQVLTNETIKQATPSSKVMTVGYVSVSDPPKDVKNHQIVSSYATIERLNSSYESVKFKSDKLEVCSTSQSHVLDWSTKEHHASVANNVDMLKSAARERNAKSPKLPASIPSSMSHSIDGQQHAMQGNSEVSMQKKKSSPRNSPRGSPRSAGSPRHPSSPRGASPRTSESSAGSQRPSFLSTHEFTGNHPTESQSKSPFSESHRSPHSEQRKSPFGMMMAAHQGTSITNKVGLSGSGGMENMRMDYHHSVGGMGIDALRVASQPCNMDSIALLKSLEASPHLSHLSALAANKDPSFLEELRPLFQKLQQQQQYSASASLVTPVNGIENFNHSSRSPLGPQSSLSKPPPASYMNNMFDNVSLPNNVHPLSVSDRENFNVNNHSSKSNKVTIEESKGANGTQCRRGSPGAATSSSASYVQGYDSSLPPPKRLTESVQKLFPLPLDNHLPHDNRRSPSNSASTTRPCVGSTVSPPSLRSGAATAGLKLPTPNDANSFEVDSITPSFTGFSSDVHADLVRGNCVSVQDTVSISFLHATEPSRLSQSQSQGNHQVTTTILTRLVPVLTGSIPSHCTGETNSSIRTTHSSALSSDSSKTIVTGVAVSAAELKTVMCNSDTKMACSAVESVTLKAHVSSSGHSGAVSHPAVRYPAVTTSEMPKSPYQQMGLSEMLQETARPQVTQPAAPSTSLHPPPANTQTYMPARTISKVTQPSDQQSAHKDTQVDSHRHGGVTMPTIPSTSSSVLPNSNQSVRSVAISQGSALLSHAVAKPSNPEYSDSDIPKLTRQTNLSIIENGPMSTRTEVLSAVESNESNSKPNRDAVIEDREANSACSSNLNPPVLTAVLDIKVSEPCETKVDSVQAVQLSVTEATVVSQQKVPALVREVSPLGPTDVSIETKSLAENASLPCEFPSVIHHPSTEHMLQNFYQESDSADPSSAKSSKVKKHPGASESVEDKSDDSDVLPRQLRSRKRNNTGESDSASAGEDSKKVKLELSAEVMHKSDTPSKEVKSPTTVKTITSHSAMSGSDNKEEENAVGESIKSGLRTRTNSKNVDDRDKGKISVGRDIKKEGRVIGGKAVVERKVEVGKGDDGKKPINRRNRPSPSVPTTDKQAAAVARDKSPLRGRTRGHNSPVVTETAEESQENKRTTRSAKTKGEPVSASSGKAMAANKRRRTSQDHR